MSKYLDQAAAYLASANIAGERPGGERRRDEYLELARRSERLAMIEQGLSPEEGTDNEQL